MERTERLPDGELEVMQAVWDRTPPVDWKDVEIELRERRPMASTTLLTFLKRLTDRGFLRVEKRGRGSVYTPLVSREDYLAAQSRRFVETVCRGSVSAFAAALCDSGLSKEDLAELRRLLEEDAL